MHQFTCHRHILIIAINLWYTNKSVPIPPRLRFRQAFASTSPPPCLRVMNESSVHVKPLTLMAL